MPPATWDTMLVRTDTHRRPQRKQLLQHNGMAFRWAVRANAKDMEAAQVGGNTLLPSARPEPRVLMPTPEDEVVSIVRGQGKQLVLLIQAKGKDDKNFWVKALVDTGAQANLMKKG